MNWSYVLERNVEQFPNKEAIVFGERRFTYRQLEERVDALAKGLQQLGLKRGDTVAILLLNCSEYLEITFAVNKVGGVWLPLNYRLAGPEVSYILNHSESKMLISEMEFEPLIRGIRKDIPGVQKFIAVGKDVPGGWEGYDHLVEANRGAKVPHAMVELDDLHRLMYTSGTTAHPKGVMITYGNLYWKNIGHIVMFDIKPEDKTLVVGPLYHVGGMDLPATGTLYAGGSVVILPRFDPIPVLQTIQKERPTNTWFAPTMVNMLFQEPTFDQYDVSSIRFIIDGGEKMPLPLITKIKEKFPNAWFADAYGLTETVSGDTFLSKDKMIEKIGSVGKPVIQLRVRIVDDASKDVPPNTLGEIVLRGPKVFKGYWKNPQATAEAIKDGWFHTGDIGTMDEEGYLYIVDRKKDIIISGGENIASLEVERVIYELPQVLETAVIGIPHPKWQEIPKAFVVLKKGEKLTADEISTHCSKKLAKFKVPKEIEFIDLLPRNPSGKVLKRELRQRHKS
ncbi:MAG: long-chain fatty acid--CoA ligase [Thermodesulfobacteriota bacterium]|nr:long-chain fatty acid--CoA ligase [Thermodesulfobacteriota bacterium]